MKTTGHFSLCWRRYFGRPGTHTRPKGGASGGVSGAKMSRLRILRGATAASRGYCWGRHLRPSSEGTALEVQNPKAGYTSVPRTGVLERSHISKGHYPKIGPGARSSKVVARAETDEGSAPKVYERRCETEGLKTEVSWGGSEGQIRSGTTMC